LKLPMVPPLIPQRYHVLNIGAKRYSGMARLQPIWPPAR
jgi:hypothetical protein